eukprot:gene3230-3443_t
MEALDVAAVTFSLATMGLYHIHLYSSVILGRNSKAQLAKMIQNSYWWAKKHQEKDDASNSTLAIHTLRNSLYVAIFVGGFSFTTALKYANSYDSTSDLNLQIRAIILSALCVCSFLCFAAVVRFNTQLGFLICTSNIPYYVKKKTGKLQVNNNVSNNESNQFTPASTASSVDCIENLDEMNGSTRSKQLQILANTMMMSFIMLSLGFRLLFVAFPFASYAMGPIGLIISTFCMFLFLIFFDYGVSALSNIDTLPEKKKNMDY